MAVIRDLHWKVREQPGKVLTWLWPDGICAAWLQINHIHGANVWQVQAFHLSDWWDSSAAFIVWCLFKKRNRKRILNGQWHTPVNMPDSVHIQSGSAWKHWQEFLKHQFASGPIRLAQTWHSHPELNWIWAGFAQYDPGRLWKNAIKSAEREKLVVGQLRPGPNDSCTLACFRTRCVWPNPDQAIQIGFRSVLHNMIHAFFEKTELNQMLHAGHNGYNWL